MKRKYWFGVSGIDGTRPDEHISIEVRDEDDFIDALQQGTEFIDKDYYGTWGDDDEGEEDTQADGN